MTFWSFQRFFVVFIGKSHEKSIIYYTYKTIPICLWNKSIVETTIETEENVDKIDKNKSICGILIKLNGKNFVIHR